MIGTIRFMKRWGAVLALCILATAATTGCSGGRSNESFSALPQDAAPAPVTSDVDTIKVGEAITITLSDIPGIVPPIEERVKEDGTITLLHNQTFQAAGKTRRQLEQEIRARYVPEFYVNMTVSVRQQENTRFYYVGGEVKQPGRQVYLGAMTVLRAVQSCGDFTEFANRRKVQLIRANGKIYSVNANRALKDPTLDLPVYPGDRIHVPRKILF